jgi:hypothetical protein
MKISAWFKEEIGLSREDLFRICAKAKEIVQELKPNDELLNLTYDTDGRWYINFARSDTDGRWKIHVFKAMAHRNLTNKGDDPNDDFEHR